MKPNWSKTGTTTLGADIEDQHWFVYCGQHAQSLADHSAVALNEEGVAAIVKTQ